MTGGRLSGKIYKNAKIDRLWFVIDSFIWCGLFSFAGYYFFPLFYFKFIFLQLNVGIGIIAGLLHAYAENQWDIPYVTAGYFLMGNMFLQFFVCWILSSYFYQV